VSNKKILSEVSDWMIPVIREDKALKDIVAKVIKNISYI